MSFHSSAIFEISNFNTLDTEYSISKRKGYTLNVSFVQTRVPGSQKRARGPPNWRSAGGYESPKVIDASLEEQSARLTTERLSSLSLSYFLV